jgi:hypothetical protein
MIAPPRHNNSMLFSGEAENTNFIDFGLTRLGRTHDLLHLMQA